MIHTIQREIYAKIIFFMIIKLLDELLIHTIQREIDKLEIFNFSYHASIKFEVFDQNKDTY